LGGKRREKRSARAAAVHKRGEKPFQEKGTDAAIVCSIDEGGREGYLSGEQ